MLTIFLISFAQNFEVINVQLSKSTTIIKKIRAMMSFVVLLLKHAFCLLLLL